MRLYQSPTSPYVRMVRAVAAARGLSDRIELVDRTEEGIEFLNPLNKVPTLVTDEGETLIESRLICQYLDDLAGPALYPADPVARRRVLQREAVIHGLLDAVVLRRLETRRSDSERSAWWETRQKRKIAAGLALIESEIEAFTPEGTVLPITLGCALDFMDRIGPELDGMDWRATCPRLAAWKSEYAGNPAMQASAPRKGR